MRELLIAIVLSSPFSVSVQTPDVEERELLRLHSELIRAHVENRPDLWMSLESADYVSANGGVVTFPTVEERREQRTSYLSNAVFHRYRDLRDPLVRVSADGSLGWLIAEVEVAGALEQPDGSTEAFEEIWAWVELYERTPDGWCIAPGFPDTRPA